MAKKIWNVTSTVLVTLVVLCALFLVGSRLMGFQVYTVLSGSMEPEYSVGDLIYVKKVDPATVKEDDVITFVLNEDLVVATHRVVRVDAENRHFYTKGDVNEVEDAEPVHFNNLIGTPVFAVPYLGFVSDFIQHPPGMYVTIAAVVLMIVLVFAPDFLRKKEKGAKEPDPAPASDQPE